MSELPIDEILQEYKKLNHENCDLEDKIQRNNIRLSLLKIKIEHYFQKYELKVLDDQNRLIAQGPQIKYKIDKKQD